MTSPVNPGNPLPPPKDNNFIKNITSWSGRIFRKTADGASSAVASAKVVGESTIEKLNAGKEAVNNIAQAGKTNIVAGAKVVGESAKGVGASTIETLNAGKEVVTKIAETGHKTARTMRFGVYGVIGIASCFAVGYLINSMNGFYKTVSEKKQ